MFRTLGAILEAHADEVFPFRVGAKVIRLRCRILRSPPVMNSITHQPEICFIDPESREGVQTGDRRNLGPEGGGNSSLIYGGPRGPAERGLSQQPKRSQLVSQ